MRRVMHSYFTPKSMEAWRPFVRDAVKELLDAAEEKGEMDVMRDLATPLPVLVIAQMMGVPPAERPHVRQLAEKLLYIGRGEYDRMKPLTEGMRGMIDYVSPLVDKRIVDPGDDFISVLAQGEKQGDLHPAPGAGEHVAAAAGRPRDDDQPAVQRHAVVHPPSRSMGAVQAGSGRTGKGGDRGVPALRFAGHVDPADRVAGRRDARQGAAQGRSDPLVHFLRQPRSRGVRRARRRSTSSGIRTSMWRSARARITAWARRWRAWRARRCSRRWPSASPTCGRRRRGWSISRASPSAR